MKNYFVAPLAGSVDRNDDALGLAAVQDAASLPSRGAWIEIVPPDFPCFGSSVAPLAGSVDRNNLDHIQVFEVTEVAPLAGSVDRNTLLPDGDYPCTSRSPRGERG